MRFARAGPPPAPGPAPPRGGVQFAEYYDVARDPWQQRNLWPHGLPAATRVALEAEIAARASCAGTRTTPSDCE